MNKFSKVYTFDIYVLAFVHHFTLQDSSKHNEIKMYVLATSMLRKTKVQLKAVLLSFRYLLGANGQVKFSATCNKIILECTQKAKM
jgi:hypothetical protein